MVHRDIELQVGQSLTITLPSGLVINVEATADDESVVTGDGKVLLEVPVHEAI